MADIYPRGICNSEPFKFFIGDEKTLFTIHSAQLKRHSKPLDALAHGHMSEAKEGSAYLEDIYPETFSQFCDYAYTGDYQVPNPESTEIEVADSGDGGDVTDLKDDSAQQGDAAEPEPEPEPAPETAPVLAVYDADDWFSSSRKVKKKRESKAWDGFGTGADSPPKLSPKERLWARFTQLPKSTSGKPPSCKKTVDGPQEDWTRVFLSHARLYAFADRYLIAPLMDLVVQKLRGTLTNLKPHYEQLDSIVALLEYTYSKTPDRSEPIDKLRDLLAHYAACIVEHLDTVPKFTDLLKKEGALGGDVIRYLVKRL